MPTIPAREIRGLSVDSEAIRTSAEALRPIVDTNLREPDGTGAKAYDLHAKRRMREARKDPRIRRMIHG